MSGRYWKLDGHEAVPCGIEEWGTIFADTVPRTVAKWNVGKQTVSTVFLGLDHSFGGGRPLLFETMVFGGPLNEEMDRYTTWEEAAEGHKAMVERVQATARGDTDTKGDLT